jgi:hypothetical protein
MVRRYGIRKDLGGWSDKQYNELAAYASGTVYRLNAYNLGTLANPAITLPRFLPTIAASSWITIEGSNLSSTTRSWNSSDFVGNDLPIAESRRQHGRISSGSGQQ